MKLTWMKWSALPVAVLMAGSVALAQDQPSPGSQPAPQAQSESPSATPAPAEKPKPTVTQRKENQQDRIANGEQTGRLTRGETANLEKKEAPIKKETAAEHAANGGTMDATQKDHIQH